MHAFLHVSIVCVYVCVRVCVFMCVCLCVRVCVCARARVCMYGLEKRDISIRVCASVYVLSPFHNVLGSSNPDLLSC